MKFKLRFVAAAVALVAPLLAQERKPVSEPPNDPIITSQTTTPPEDLDTTPTPPKQSLSSVLANSSLTLTTLYGDPHNGPNNEFLRHGEVFSLGQVVPQTPPATQGGMFYDATAVVPLSLGSAGHLTVIGGANAINSSSAFVSSWIPSTIVIGIWDAPKGFHVFAETLNYHDGSKNYRRLFDVKKDISSRVSIWGHYTRSLFYVPETGGGAEVRISNAFSATAGLVFVHTNNVPTGEFGVKSKIQNTIFKAAAWTSHSLGTTASLTVLQPLLKGMTSVWGTYGRGYDTPVFPGHSKYQGGITYEHSIGLKSLMPFVGGGYDYGVNGLVEEKGRGRPFIQMGLHLFIKQSTP